MSSEEEDFTNLPVEDKVAHKSWKARQMGYEQLQQQFELSDPNADQKLFDTWADEFKKFTADANLVAQETALSTLIAYLQFAPVSSAIRCRNSSMKVLVEKCIGSARGGTRQKALEALLLFVEVDTPAPVIETLTEVLSAKQPKLVAFVIVSLREIVRLFGAQTVDVKPIMKKIVTIFGHSDKQVRAEAAQLVVELYKWIGKSAFDSIFKELKPVQVKELDELFTSIEEKGTQQRFLRSQSSLASSQQGSLEDLKVSVEPSPNVQVEIINAYDLSEPIDVLSKIPDTFWANSNSVQWKERKEALDDLLKILDVPHYTDDAYQPLISALTKRVADINIVCAGVAINCIEKVARGIQSGFSQFKSQVISLLLEKFKERKQTVVVALRDALDAVFLTVSLNDVTNDIVEACKSKNPQVRQETTMWLVRNLKAIKNPPTKSDLKSLAELLTSLIEDSIPEVRDAAMEALGTLIRVSGDKACGHFLEKVDPLKMTKIREFQEKALVKCSATEGSARPTTSMTSSVSKTHAVKSAASSAKPSPALSRKPTISRPSTSSAPASKSLASSRAGSSDSKKLRASAKKISKPELRFRYSEEDVENRVADIFNEAELNMMNDPSWKIRLEVMDAIIEKCKSREEIDGEFMYRLLRKRAVWKDNNFQVMARLFQLTSTMSDSNRVSSAAASMIIPVIVDKIGDAKLRPIAYEALVSLSQQCSLATIISLTFEPLQCQKSPKAICEMIKVYNELVNEFGVLGIDIQELLNATKTYLGNANPSIRSACVQLLGTLRVFLGADIRALLSDLPPAQLTTIDAEFQRVSADEKPVVTRVQKVDASSGVNTESAIEDLLPRADISAQITTGLIENINNSNWKVRKEGLDQVVEILESANRKIKPSTGDLLPALKARLVDSNKNLVMQALEICSTVALAMGSPFDKYVKIVLANTVSNLNDNKQQVRVQALKALDSYIFVSSLDSMLSTFAQCLAADSPNLRKELLTWLCVELEKRKEKKFEMACMINPLFACLQDRSQEVRKIAQNLLPFVVKNVGFDQMKEKCTDLKGAAAQSILPLIEAHRDVAVVQTLVKDSIPGKQLKRASSSASTRPASAIAIKKRTSVNTSSNSVVKEPAEAILDSECPILTSELNLKERRADQDRGLTKWSFDAPRKDLIDFLCSQMEVNFSSSLVKCLFSDDHHKDRDFMNGLTLLDDLLADPRKVKELYQVDLEDFQQRVLANSDLILKYVTIRLFDTNTSILLKALDLLERLFDVLDNGGYHLTDYEANCFLPSFIPKIGDSKETIRNRVRNLLKKLCRIYPASKMFTFVLNSLGTKNARARSECLEELGSLIQRNGMNVCNPARSFPLIAAQIADRDSSVRNSAISAIVQAYALIGETVFKYLGRLPEKDKDMLEERIKRSKSSAPRSPSKAQIQPEEEKDRTRPNTAVRSSLTSATRTSQQGQFSLDLDQLNLPKLSYTAPTEKIESTATKGRTGSISTNNDYLMDFLLSQVTSGDIYQSIDALKQLEKQITAQPAFVLPQINPLINAVTLQVRLAFTSPSLASAEAMTLVRLCKHLVNVLVQMFSNEQMGSAVSRETMHQLLSELITRLVDQGIHQQTENGAQLARALNVLMLRVLENSNANSTFSVLLDLLDAGVLVLGPQTDSNSIPAKYAELVMKCLWKLTKSLQQNLQQNRLSAVYLLKDVHKFLTTTPPAEWKRRAQDKLPLGDMPLRTAKTILNELVAALGANVLKAMEEAVEDSRRSVVHQYLLHMLESSGAIEQSNTASMKQQIPEPTNQLEKQVSLAAMKVKSPGEMPAPPLSKNISGAVPIPRALTANEALLAIDDIFNKIASKEQTKEGTLELYQFQRHYPQHQDKINAKLASHGVNFRIYLRRNLAKIAEERGETLPDENTNPALEEKKSPSRASSTVEEAENFKERLAKLQEMFGYRNEGQPSPEIRSPSLSPKKLVEDQQQSIVGRSTDQDQHPVTDASVMALKERLARMKSAMSATNVV